MSIANALSFLFVGVIACITFACPASATNAETREEQNKRIALNDSHREMFATEAFEPLDDSMNKVQLGYEKGEWRELQIVSLFNTPFKGTDRALEELYAQWVAAYQNSYAAHLARGFYYAQRVSGRIEEARKKGAFTADDEAELKHCSDMAIKSNTAALTLAKKPLLAYANLIDVYAFSGSLAESKKMLEAANKSAPKNVEARFRYMKALEKYGANIPEMQKVIEGARQNGLSRRETAQMDAVFYGALLRAAQFALLEKELAGVQRDYEAGKIDDLALLSSFSFSEGEADPALEGQYNVWVKAYPESYAARQARAMYLYRVGFHARGYKYARETTAEEMAGFRLYMRRAYEDANAALAMTPKPLLTYNTIILVAMANGSSLELREQFLTKANQIDPKNSIVRYAYMSSAQTRWGGSLAEMTKIAEQAKKSGMVESLHMGLENMILQEKQWLAGRIIEKRRDIGQLRTGF